MRGGGQERERAEMGEGERTGSQVRLPVMMEPKSAGGVWELE